MLPPFIVLDPLIGDWLREDIGRGDRSTMGIFPKGNAPDGRAVWFAKADGVIAGMPIAARVFQLLDGTVNFEAIAQEGQSVKAGQAIAEIRAGNKQPDPRLAPSLQALRDTVKKGLSFGEMLERMAAGKEKGLWEPWMTTFGIEIRAVNYGAGPRNACLVLDLAANAPAHAMFAKAGIQNWRSLAADDCSVVRSEKATETSPLKVYAVFYLDPLPA